MPDFRPLFFIAKVLTCCCYRRKSPKPEAQNQPYQVEHTEHQYEEASSNYSQRSGMPRSPGGALPRPDVFVDVQINDDAGVNSVASGSGSNSK
ncbi:uncharacterized protein FTOL_03765 [Fusarium torulosum]|uniref:Uncharacterized protein n=1 Tax=Fusarium torulosum TaxID=33205 RepID=A0AAE8M4K3_9HYPO|nr:uncharacterized protein FTOL_03765 [Fusarium torulosum]